MADKARINNAKAQLSESYNALLDHFHATELKVIGNYNVVRLIGQGSFGKVYLATHKFTNTKVVLKSSAKSAPNLVREIHHHRQFKHPHITRLHEIIVTETVVWMVLEYCPGDELYTYLVENGRLSVDETRKIFAQLCGAVTYVHNTKNCVHRDLKLENILLDRHHNVKLCDFGFTRGYESRVMLETICGTSAYMAPEMLRGKKYSGEAVDVWSLGVILYALVCGEMPFDEEDEEDTKNRIMNVEPDYAKHQLPQDMLVLLKGMLCKNPHQRPKLVEVLNNGFLGLEGMRQAELLAAKEPKLFSTKMEKHVLKRMKALNISIENLYESVSKMKCDSLAGFWAASLEKAYKKERRKQSRRRSRSAFSYSFDIARKRPSEENIGDSLQQSPAAPHSPSSPLSKVRHFDGLGIRNRLSGDYRRPSSEQMSTPRQSLDFRPPHRSTTTGEAMTSPPAPDSPRSPREHTHSRHNSTTNTPDTSVTLERPHTVGESPRLQASPFDNRSVTSDGSSLKKKGNFGKSLKNVMLKMVFIGKKRPTEPPKSEPSNSSGTGRSLPSSLHSYSIKNKSNTSLEEPLVPTETVPDVPPLPQSAPGLTSMNSQDNIEPMTSFRRTTRRERPISQISSFSGISQISGISGISSAPSVSSSLERSGSGSRRIVMRRPYFGRRSTSSSFSSIQSHRKTHSKASSTSSTDEYLGDDTTDPGSPGPSETPTTTYGRHSTRNKKAHSKQHDYNETAQFNTYKPPSRRRKSATKVSSPNMALFPSRSRPTNSKRPDRKGSVIEEEVEDEYVEESYDGDDGLDFDQRGRSF